MTDIYDAITQERHYKPALSREAALKVLRAEAAGGRIDAALVELFCSRIDQITAQADAVGLSVRGTSAGIRPPALNDFIESELPGDAPHSGHIH